MIRDDKSWRIFASCEVRPAPCISKQELGVIGLDINSDHLALVETDGFGNPIHKETFPMPVYGKSKDQSSAIIGDLAAEVIAFAEKAQKPLVIEDLDFQKKKATLRENKTASFSRMLSSFSYESLKTHLKSRGSKKGIEVIQVNPAYTSIIGRVKFAKRYGLTVHHAAALTIGRRYLKFSEKLPSHLEIPDGKEGYVTLPYPQRNRDKHVWHFWRQLNKKVLAALAAHYRTAKADPRAHNCS
jgi:IS605 OrfB family transposase